MRTLSKHWQRGLCLAAWGLSGCTRPTPTPPSAVAPVEQAPCDILVDPTAMSRDFLWRQRLTATYDEHQYRFEAVLEKSGPTLRVLFLTPYGTRALLLEQRHEQVHTEYFIPQRLPFPPERILGDIHRAYFRGFDRALPSGGTREYREHGEMFEDTWQGGRLVQRVATAPGSPARDNSRTKRVAIAYTPGFVPGTPPARVMLTNDWHGYQILIETIDSE